MWKFFLLILVLLSGCTIPALVYFRNYSDKKVRLQATLVNRSYFKKLPNLVDFYDTATKRKEYFGHWQSGILVTWVDSTTFYIDIPPATVINIADISKGLVLGARQPDVLLLLINGEKRDTLTTGDYLSLAKKFKSTGYGAFKTPVYYYDIH
jgi:hypothetical protein